MSIDLLERISAQKSLYFKKVSSFLALKLLEVLKFVNFFCNRLQHNGVNHFCRTKAPPYSKTTDKIRYFVYIHILCSVKSPIPVTLILSYQWILDITILLRYFEPQCFEISELESMLRILSTSKIYGRNSKF